MLLRRLLGPAPPALEKASQSTHAPQLCNQRTTTSPDVHCKTSCGAETVTRDVRVSIRAAGQPVNGIYWFHETTQDAPSQRARHAEPVPPLRGADARPAARPEEGTR